MPNEKESERKFEKSKFKKKETFSDSVSGSSSSDEE